MKQIYRNDTIKTKEIFDSKEHHVAQLKKKGQIPTVVYHHLHHLEKQDSSRQGREHQHTYEPTWNQK
jgi:hypothetical protein